MSKPKQIFNLDVIPEKNTILKRLLEVALYDYVNNHISISTLHLSSIKALLEIIIPDYNVDEIMIWLLTPEAKPTKFELVLVYNQMRVSTLYIRAKLKLNNSNINAYKKDRLIRPNILSNETLINILAGVIKINWTVFNYNIFRKIEWER